MAGTGTDLTCQRTTDDLWCAIHRADFPDGAYACLGERQFGRTMYLDLADELSADPRFLDDQADPPAVASARAFAASINLPWPPSPDLDIALDMVRQAEEVASIDAALSAALDQAVAGTITTAELQAANRAANARISALERQLKEGKKR